MRALPTMRNFAPVVFDATLNSVQMPSAANGVSGGQPEFIPVLARSSGCRRRWNFPRSPGWDDPAHAKSDGADALRLDKLQGLLEQLLAVHAAVAAK